MTLNPRYSSISGILFTKIEHQLIIVDSKYKSVYMSNPLAIYENIYYFCLIGKQSTLCDK